MRAGNTFIPMFIRTFSISYQHGMSDNYYFKTAFHPICLNPVNKVIIK